MVMYTDNGKGTLTLNYETTPGAAEVIRDIREAPIEVETFASTKCGIAVADTKNIVVDVKLGAKALKEVETEISKTYKKVSDNPLTFELPESVLSEQAKLMR